MSNLPQGGQWSREPSPSQPPKQQSGNWQPSNGASPDSQRAVNTSSSNGQGLSSNAGQSFPPSPSRGMPSNNSPFSASAQQSPSPFSRGGQPGNSGNGQSSPVDAQQSPSPFSRGTRSNGGVPVTPPSSSGPLSRGLRSNGEFPSFSSPRNGAPEVAGTNGQAQEQEYQRPFLFSASPIPETPRPYSTFTSASAMDNRQLNTPLPTTDSNVDQMQTQQRQPRTDGLSSRKRSTTSTDAARSYHRPSQSG